MIRCNCNRVNCESCGSKLKVNCEPIDWNKDVYDSNGHLLYKRVMSRTEIHYDLGFVSGVLQTLVLGGKLTDNEKNGCEQAINKIQNVLKAVSSYL